jgi:hypothetical protein
MDILACPLWCNEPIPLEFAGVETMVTIDTKLKLECLIQANQHTIFHGSNLISESSNPFPW